MPFWKRRAPVADAPDIPSEPLDPQQFLGLTDALGRSCADEVSRLGGDAEQVLATLWFTEAQEVTRVQLTSDGMPMQTGKRFARELTEQAVPLRAQPDGGRLDRLEVTVADGQLRTEATYRD